MNMIVPVTKENLSDAAYVHSITWKESHRSFCDPAFVERHTPERQASFLLGEMEKGKRLFLLSEDAPVGIVSVDGSVIENLYVLPERQGRGYGTRLLLFAVSQCAGDPVLWVLNVNPSAKRLYERHSFSSTGRVRRLNDTIFEIEMVKQSAGRS